MYVVERTAVFEKLKFTKSNEFLIGSFSIKIIGKKIGIYRINKNSEKTVVNLLVFFSNFRLYLIVGFPT